MFNPINQLILSSAQKEALILMLVLPVAATIIAFARQIIGVKGFGLYTPLIITLSFVIIGLDIGLAVFAIALIVGIAVRTILKHLYILYLPRIAIVLIITSLIIFLIFWLNIFGLKNHLFVEFIFAILILVALVEKFITAQIERGNRNAITLTIETIGVSVICYYITTLESLQIFALKYPLLLIISTLIINILIGKWTGLRLIEYWRFREVIKKI